jgi:hypothetical protein
MAVCSFVTMLIVLIVGHFRDGELHDCGDFCSLLVSRHAFRSEDSWLGCGEGPGGCCGVLRG